MRFQEPKTKPYCEVLKSYIIEQLQYEFSEIFLSHNLIDTMEIKEINDGYIIEIPAEVYDIDIYKNKKVVVYTGEGSYADEVDISGGFSGKHKNYVDRAISKSMRKWKKWLLSQKLYLRKYKDIHSAYKMTLQKNKNWYRRKSESRENREFIKEQKKLYKKKLSKYTITGKTPKRVYRGKKEIGRTIRGIRAKRQRRG